MKRIGGIDHKRLHLDDERVVSEFCESARDANVGATKEDETLIAIADIRSVIETSNEELRRGSLSTRRGRGLTAAQLHEELTKGVSTPSPLLSALDPNGKQQRDLTTYLGGDRKLMWVPPEQSRAA